jgi:hypothetical protein
MILSDVTSINANSFLMSELFFDDNDKQLAISLHRSKPFPVTLASPAIERHQIDTPGNKNKPSQYADRQQKNFWDSATKADSTI